jgi:hypothetical protein
MRLRDYPMHLRGEPNNRYGGHNTNRMRGFKGNTYGPAGLCRAYSKQECRKVEEELRRRGLLATDERRREIDEPEDEEIGEVTQPGRNPSNANQPNVDA